jgi:predicted small metal-binding protein
MPISWFFDTEWAAVVALRDTGTMSDTTEDVYQYVCDHVIPGCTYVAEGSEMDKLRKAVKVHMIEHHEMFDGDERIANAMKTGFTSVKPY